MQGGAGSKTGGKTGSRTDGKTGSRTSVKTGSKIGIRTVVEEVESEKQITATAIKWIGHS